MTQALKVTPSQIGWGSYQAYEGPLFWGRNKVEIPSDGDFYNNVLAAITATESKGCTDPYNGYDRCISTQGLYQWCEAAYRFSQKMLGGAIEAAAKKAGDASDTKPFVDIVNSYLGPVQADFVNDAHTGWTLRDRGIPVVTNVAMRNFYLAGSTGLVGQWKDWQRAQAKLIAATFVSIHGVEQLAAGQMEYSKPKALEFVFGAASKQLFAKGFPTQGWEGAMRVIHISYCANLPAVASRIYEANARTYSTMTPKDRCIAHARNLAFAGIGIWPARYNHLRPTIEKRFEVDLPDFANELRTYEFEGGEATRRFAKLEAVQEALMSMKIDLGPKGADGVPGPKTTAAIIEFQKKVGLVPDGIFGPLTMAALHTAAPPKK